METKMTEQESLRIITEMIESTKMKIRDNGFFYLLWGWLVLTAILSNYILWRLEVSLSWLPWPVLMGGGVVVSWIAGYRIGRERKVKTYFDTVMIYLWNGFMVVLLLILFLAGKGYFSWVTADVLIVALYGMGVFVSGGMVRFRPLIFGGVFAWVMALGMFFIPEEYFALMFALAVIGSYLVPGYMLRARYQKEVRHV